jgi:hypothetical protein
VILLGGDKGLGYEVVRDMKKAAYKAAVAAAAEEVPASYLPELLFTMASAMDEMKIPGTVQLVDLAGTMQTRHSDGHSDIVLVPTPSDDPDDPLNWSKSRKLLSSISIAV